MSILSNVVHNLSHHTFDHHAPTIGVVGYYHCNNLGDEQYKKSIPLLLGLKSHDCEFLNIVSDEKQIVNHIRAKRWSLLVIGGGDLINDYFLPSLVHICKEFQQHSPDNVIIAVSIGIPFENSLHDKCVTLFPLCDYVFLRNNNVSGELMHLQQCFGTMRIRHLPDAAFFLLPPAYLTRTTARESSSSCIFRLGISLIPSFRKHLLPFAKTICKWLKNRMKNSEMSTAFISLLVFDQSDFEKSSDNSDLQTVGTLSKHIQQYATKHRLAIRVEISLENDPSEMIEKIGKLDLLIAMRFHAHIFAMIAATPVISLSSCRKVTQLIQEIEKSWKYCGSTDSLLWSCCLENDFKCLASQLQDFENLSQQQLEKFRETMSTISKNRYQSLLVASQTIFPVLRQSKNQELCPVISETKFHENSLYFEKLEKQYQQLVELQKNNELESLARDLCFAWTGDMNSVYFYGTLENLLSFSKTTTTKSKSLHSLSDWVKQDLCQRWLEDRKKQQRYNIDWFSQKESAIVHRAGWNFVCTYLQTFSAAGGLLCDLYLDRTFLWARDSMIRRGLLPYTQPWIGFLHHTAFDWYSPHNARQLCRQEVFQLSLPTCFAIIVLSQTLANWLTDQLQEICIERGFSMPRIIVLWHPTEVVELRWSPSCLLSSSSSRKCHQLISIGAWLRNPLSIYRLALPKRSLFEKVSLKGFQMDSQFPPPAISKFSIDTVEDDQYLSNHYVCVVDTEKQTNSICHHQCDDTCHPCRPHRHHHHDDHHKKHSIIAVYLEKQYACNQWMLSLAYYVYQKLLRHVEKHVVAGHLSTKTTRLVALHTGHHLFKNENEKKQSDHSFSKYLCKLEKRIIKWIDSVKIIDRLENQQYDQLLAHNVVFLELYDASAVNTVIECIMRSTPIIVNRLPALIEYLGQDYPLFYDNLKEVSMLLADQDRLIAAHLYLKDLPSRHRLHIDYFASQFCKAICK